MLTVIADVLHRAKPRGAIALSPATGGASRRIAVSCPCEASRAIALLVRAKPSGLLLAGRTKSRGHIACWPICGASRPLESSGAHDLCPDCLDSLRPSERAKAHRVICEADRGSEWSGCKAGESVECAGETVPILGARHEHKCRLGEAGLNCRYPKVQ